MTPESSWATDPPRRTGPTERKASEAEPRNARIEVKSILKCRRRGQCLAMEPPVDEKWVSVSMAIENWRLAASTRSHECWHRPATFHTSSISCRSSEPASAMGDLGENGSGAGGRGCDGFDPQRIAQAQQG